MANFCGFSSVIVKCLSMLQRTIGAVLLKVGLIFTLRRAFSFDQVTPVHQGFLDSFL